MYLHLPLSDIMTTDLVTVAPSDTMDKVDQIFKTHDFHHVPVVDEQGVLQGIISKSDFLMMCDSMTIFRREQEKSQNLQFFRSLLTKEVMAKNAITLQPDNTALQAADLFKENLFHALPIVDEAGKLLGIVTTFDLIQSAYRQPSYLSE